VEALRLLGMLLDISSAVYGHASSTSRYVYGGYFMSDSTGGRGVYGEAVAKTGKTLGGQFIINIP